MSPDLELLAVDTFACPVCGREKGLCCETPGSRPRPPHEARLELALLRRRELEKLASWKGQADGVL
jgi:hypothetical protein